MALGPHAYMMIRRASLLNSHIFSIQLSQFFQNINSGLEFFFFVRCWDTYRHSLCLVMGIDTPTVLYCGSVDLLRFLGTAR